MQKGLDLLLNKYSVDVKAEINSAKSVKIGENQIPLLPFESERRFIELRNLVLQKRVGNMCTYRIGNTSSKSSDIFELLKREAGIVEFTVNSKIIEIFAICGKNTMNVIAETENGCVCTIELACTLNEGEETIDKHEIITDNGIACDMVVDTQTPKSSIYVYGDNSASFTDTDAELYGYSQTEICTIRNAFSVCKDSKTAEHNVEQNARLDKIVEAAKISIEALENVKVGA